MRLLIATDGSSQSRTAARTACRLLKKQDLAAHLLCAVPETQVPQATAWGARARQAYQRRIHLETALLLNHAKEAVAAEGVEASTAMEHGSPAGVLLSAAENYDLIVLGAEGRDTPKGATIGPVSSRVLEHSDGSVFIGRPLRSTDGYKVLVAVDGSTASREALETLAEWFDLESASVTLMHVIESPWLHLGLEQDWYGYEEPAEDRIDPELPVSRELRREGELLLERARDILRPSHSAVEVKLEEGNPGDQILAELDRESYDLLVIGATGVSTLKRQMLGSVSFKLAWNAPCSVLLSRVPA